MSNTDVVTDDQEAQTIIADASDPPADNDGDTPAADKSAAPVKTDKAPDDPGATLAGGGEAVKTPVPTDFPDDWRVRFAGEDKKALKTLERMATPADLWKSYSEAKSALNAGDLVKVPGKKATKDEVAAFNKALGVPETPEAYLDNIKLSKDRVLGDDDKPVLESFVKAMHPAGATPAVVNAATNWWFDYQQAVQEQQEQSDSDFRIESEIGLKQELGGNYTRATNAIGTLFSQAPKEVVGLLLNGRTADGHKLGDHPLIVKWLAETALELNPAASMQAPDGDSIKAMDEELANLRKLMANDESEYWVGPKSSANQARMAELLEMQEKIKARRAA